VPIPGRLTARSSLVAVLIYFLTVLLIFHQTTWSMVSIWLRSDTFAHGFVILPISLWLVWLKRDHLASINPVPAPWVVVLIIPPGIVWLLAELVDVVVVQQLALVALLVIGAWAILGHRLARVVAFPLFFLFFAVPMGEALTAPMMEFTATSTVWLIQLTGVPVYREGLFFYLPSGSWSVVEACSGVRYVIASVTLGVLYAYLTYRTFWRRALFILVSAVVPVIANSMRAYMIVMLGHISNMKLATGVDHLLYGWVFFGFVMIVLFWLGSFFHESDDAANSLSSSLSSPGAGAGIARLLVSGAAAFVVVCVWPVIAHYKLSTTGPGTPVVLVMPAAAGAWSSVESPSWQWRPDTAVVGEASAFYAIDGKVVGLFIQYLEGTGIPEGEVVGSSARFVEHDSAFRVIGREKTKVVIDRASFAVEEAEIKGVDGKLLAWSWYRVGDTWTSNEYVAKFWEIAGQLGFVPLAKFRVVIGVPMVESTVAARHMLQRFLDTHAGQLSQALRSVQDVR
jgi:exosortase A